MEELLIKAADVIIRKYDPCRLSGHSCRVREENPCCFNTPWKRDDPEDNRCKHLADDGKCLNVNHECKIWFCETALKAMDPECLTSVYGLEALAKRHGLVKPPFLGDHYYGADKPLC